MNGKLYFMVGLAMGFAAGAVITWYKLNDQYEALQNEEFEKRREEAAKERKGEEKDGNVTNIRHDAKKLHEKPSIMEYAERLNKEGYTNYSKSEEDRFAEQKTEPTDASYIYVISPDTYDEGVYEKISLTYYSDGVLANEVDEEMDAETCGDFAEHFGEYEDDVVYVRDDARELDYEICKDNRTFQEVSGNKPHRVEV